jgi:AraC family transcriptional regulator
MPNSGYGKPLSQRFGIPNPPTLVTNVSPGAAITFSRLRLGCAQPAFHVPAEDAYSIHVNLMKTMSGSVSTRGRAAERYSRGEGDSMMLDLSEAPTVTLHSPLNTVRLYVPRLAIRDFAQEEYGAGEVYLKPPQRIMRDPILHHLGTCLRALLEHPEENNFLLVDHIALSLQSHLYLTYLATPSRTPDARGGLAPWQESRAKEAMDAALDKEITIAQLALDCGLSAGHFARAFRKSTGYPPHHWLLRRRVERAQDLLLTSDKPLAEIASACGYSNQSHLTRAFGQAVGISPGLWRRTKRA